MPRLCWTKTGTPGFLARWLHHFKRLLVATIAANDIHEAFLAIGCCLVCFRRLQPSS
jgi:hypothetical protein